MAAKLIELVQQHHGSGPLDPHPMYHVMFRGQKYGELYFNMTGYTGCYLPAPRPEGSAPIAFDPGEISISAYKKVIARLNREWSQRA